MTVHDDRLPIGRGIADAARTTMVSTDNTSRSHRRAQWTRWWAWTTLGIVLATILMGAVVRATASGDGCGRSWPTCHGTLVISGTGDSAQLIEFSHRAISGLSLLAMLLLVVLVHRAFASRHPARRAVRWSMVLLIIEALIGAAIVLYGWVAEDRSVARQVSVPLHLVNSFLLMASLGLTIWLVEGHRLPNWRAGGRRTWSLLALIVGFLLIAATGATTSLADTLFAVDPSATGTTVDFEAEEALIMRLRIVHPFAAIGIGFALAWYAWRVLDETAARGHPWPARIIVGAVVVQAGLGFIHIALLTPLVTALLHLLLAEVLWLALAFLVFTLLAPTGVRAPSRRWA